MTFLLNYSNAALVNFRGLLTFQQIEALVNNKNLRTLQFNEPVDARNWPLLEEHLFHQRSDVCLRAYGHYSSHCDLDYLKQLPSLQKLIVNCLRRASNIETIQELPNLRYLGIGIYELDSFDFLSKVSHELRSLDLGPTLSKKPRLDILLRFSKLEELNVCGHNKDLLVIEKLTNLEKLSLIGLSSPQLSFLHRLSKLWSLTVLLGGTEDLSQIAQATALKHLDLTRIRRLSDLQFISKCTNLQNLNLEHLRQVEVLPVFKPLTDLRRLAIIGLKGLKSVDSVGDAPALEILTGSSSLQPADFRIALQAPSLRKSSHWFGSEKKGREFVALAAQYGVDTEFKWEEFVYN